MKRASIVSDLVLAVVALLFVWTDRPPTDPHRDSENAAAQVDALLAPWSKGDTPGAAITVIENGRVLLEKGYGLANLETKQPIDPDTAFLLCSVTKQFTAMSIMILAERGKLRYDDALSSFFPEFPPYAQKITIRHLLQHTAGLPEYDDLFRGSGKIDRFWPRSAKSRPSSFEPTSKDVLQILAQQKALQFAPGEKWEYSNSGYVVLAQIVEKVTGQTFAQFLQQEIFQPLGMKRSRLYDETRPTIQKRATSYKGGGIYREIDYAPQNAIYGEDNIYTTVEDMYAWDQALYTEKLVRAATLKEAFTPGRLNDGTTTNYGFGWGLNRVLGLEALEHGGAWLGFRTYILRFPTQRFTVIVLSNLAQFEPDKIAAEISKIYLD
jgi:CubicO group peptidase (beta-lactamase class C family)